MVVDAKTGSSKLDDIRTSYGAAFGRGEDVVIAEIEARIAEWTHLPPELGEPIQVLRYQNGQQYGAHWDWFDDPVHQAQYLQNGNRYATVLLYLSEVEEGGETTLPLATALDEAAQTLNNPSLCASRMGIAIKPVKGDALLFFDMDIQATKGDRFALHASCPTLKARPSAGTATDACWVVAASVGGHEVDGHQMDSQQAMRCCLRSAWRADMGSYDAAQQGGRCADTGSNCAAKVGRLGLASWAGNYGVNRGEQVKSGEAKEGACETEAETLMGPAGTCRRTCKDCVPCPSGDILCYRRNMRGSRSATLPGSRPV
ncbi:hypothetical protein QJQ45_021203 [Haematococcus lacustris]|nr:hypothetical protein QJQ45_021203 [Haematococcus lacustris]